MEAALLLAIAVGAISVKDYFAFRKGVTLVTSTVLLAAGVALIARPGRRTPAK